MLISPQEESLSVFNVVFLLHHQHHAACGLAADQGLSGHLRRRELFHFYFLVQFIDHVVSTGTQLWAM